MNTEFDYPVPSVDFLLGAINVNGHTDFRLWAPAAESVSVALYYNRNLLDPFMEIPLVYDWQTGVWSGAYQSDEKVGIPDIDGMLYDYKIVRNGIEQTVQDPYAYSLCCFTGTADCRAAIVNIKSKKAKSDGGWFPDAREPLLRKNDAVIYEISVRDFTISDDSGVYMEKGTFEAFIERLPSLKALGVTHIQLMPVLAFGNHNEKKRNYQSENCDYNNYNWGYDPRNFFSPDGWFAEDPEDPYSRIRDLRNLVAAAHSMGLKVLLDVVYNHLGDSSLLNNIVPDYYFRHDNNGFLTNASGCGNDLATERYMVRKLIVDSTRYLMRSFRIDGFRFDLMGLIDTGTIQAAYDACAKILPDVLFIGEGWRMYNGIQGTIGMDQNFMQMTLTASVFNDEFRDAAKGGGFNERLGGFLTGRDVEPESLFRYLTGRTDSYTCLVPDSNVLYLACHDGLTLHDSIAINAKLDPSIPSQKAELYRRQSIGNFMLFTSQGIVFVQGGQEYGRSKKTIGTGILSFDGYESNSYCSSDDVNKYVWTYSRKQQKLRLYTQKLIRLRRNLEIFHLPDYAQIESRTELLPDSDSKSLAFTIADLDGNLWFVLYNMNFVVRSFTLKQNHGMQIIADSLDVYDESQCLQKTADVEISDTSIIMQPLSCALVFAKV